MKDTERRSSSFLAAAIILGLAVSAGAAERTAVKVAPPKTKTAAPTKSGGMPAGAAVKKYVYKGPATSDSGCGNCSGAGETRDNCKAGDSGTTASPPQCQPGGTFCCYKIYN